jgi:branched-chain amino acid transport system substrate-binding protein
MQSVAVDARAGAGLSLRRTARTMVTAAIAGTALFGFGAAQAQAQGQQSKDTLKVGVVTFLSGPAAGPFGVPAKKAAELMVKAINEGSLPAPYNSQGIGGRKLEAVYIDEAGPTTTQVTEMRNLVQRQGVDVIIGYISSGNCLAVAPVAEELKTMTLLFDCGTPRVFEERDYRYVFRTTPHATMDNVAAARYMADTKPKVKTVSAINQNYAWGQDSWRDFELALKTVKPDAKIDKVLFPKLFAGDYSAELSALSTSRPDVIHSSLWGGDLDAFLVQGKVRGLGRGNTLVLTAGETSMESQAKVIPEGTLIGTRGPNGPAARDTELNRWFVKSFGQQFNGERPVFPAYHMGQAFLALKTAFDKAAAKNNGKATTEQAIDALEYLEFPSFGTDKVSMALGKGHQAVSETAYGTFKMQNGKPTLTNVKYYPAWCVNPPKDMTAEEWLKAGMPGAQCK